MKKLNTLAFIFVFLSFIHSSYAQAPADVFISEYIEGSSNNKAIEIYNGTGSSIDLAAGNYVIQMFFNGSTTASTTIALTGTIANNSVFVLANASASFATAAFVNQTNSASWYNGDDAVVLKKGGATGTIVDAFGQVGFDPGTEWGTGLVSTADNTLRRKTAVCSGDIDASDIFDPAAQWDGFATDDFSNLGTHTTNCSVAGSSINLTPSTLSFTALVNTTSAAQGYLLQGSGLVDDVLITAPTNFEIATSSTGAFTNSLTVSADAANAGTTLYIVYHPTAIGASTGNITHVSGRVTSNLVVKGTATSGDITHIYTIQGTDAASPFDGSIVTTKGIVTGVFQGVGQLGGFYLQDADGDGDSLTSDGIFVFDTADKVSVGDMVQLAGEVDEYFNLTELKNINSFSIVSSGNALMQPVIVSLPVDSIAALEKYENMLVRFSQNLTVTETFNLGRYGELLLSSDGRLFNPTNFVDPNDNPASGTSSTGNSNVISVANQQDLNNRRTILLDDGSNVQNPPVVPFLNPVDTTIRSGTTVQNITGVLTYSFGEYLLEPTAAPAFNYAQRPAVPAVGSANLKVASFNVLNYFNGDGAGGGFPTPRGANTLVEFNRQRAKIIAAIAALNADVVGLTEIENDGDGAQSAIADLTKGLNEATAAGTYAYIADPTGNNGNTGTDAIKVAIIYKPSAVAPVGAAMADISPIHNRPPLAQTFSLNSNGEKMTMIINHFKSKSCTDASGANADQGDGQGCYNLQRKIQADSLLSFIKKMQAVSGDLDVIAVGDFNAYDEEDPIDILRAGGLSDILPGTYSYVFDGQAGSLDHGFVTTSLSTAVTGAAKWHINADEPTAKDYNQEFNPAYLYSPGPYRSSDHDPVLAGINLQSAQNTAPVVAITSPVNGTSFNAGDSITITATATDADGTIKKVAFYSGNTLLGVDSTYPYQLVWQDVESGTDSLFVKAFDNTDSTAVSDTVVVNVNACVATGWISEELFANISGAKVSDLTSSPKYPDHPYIKALVRKFESPSNIGDQYGVRVRGYICAPATGNYVFNIASDDNSELWLSASDDTANLVKIAYVNGMTPKRAWNYYPSQKSVAIKLVKGKRYYIEALHKEKTGKDHLAVAWTLPNGTFEGPIPGKRLSPYTTATTANTASFADDNAVVASLKLADEDFNVTVSPNPTKTFFTLNIRDAQNKNVSISVTDVLGRAIETLPVATTNSTVKFGNAYKPGIYFVKATQGSQQIVIKVMKQ